MATIYIIEDDEFMSRLYERMFKDGGYAIKIIPRAEEVFIELATAHERPALILCDIMMPEVSGFDVLKQLKQNPDLKSIPVVMWTNLGGKEEAEKAMALGADGYLVKSDYGPKETLAKVEEILGQVSKKDA